MTADYQQIDAWFEPDQKNFVKVETEHNGTGEPHLTMFYRQNGISGVDTTFAVPALTHHEHPGPGDQGQNTVPDPAPYGDTCHVSGSLLDELTVYYSLNGALLTQLGSTTEFPAAVSTWFSRQAKPGPSADLRRDVGGTGP